MAESYGWSSRIHRESWRPGDYVWRGEEDVTGDTEIDWALQQDLDSIFVHGDSLRRYEQKASSDDRARFRDQVEALAETDSEVAEWLDDHPWVLEW